MNHLRRSLASFGRGLSALVAGAPPMLRGPLRLWPLTLALALPAALGLWLLGCFRYTAVGVDIERERAGIVLATHYRVRWPGDGSLWVGAERLVRPAGHSPVQPLDLAAAWFLRPRPREPQSIWNRLGFWWVQRPAERWLGLPGWLLPLGVGALARWLRGRAG